MEPPKTYCESHEHNMVWWGLPFGQFMVCTQCAFATKFPSGEPVETDWVRCYDAETGYSNPELDHWMPTEKSVRFTMHRWVT